MEEAAVRSRIPVPETLNLRLRKPKSWRVALTAYSSSPGVAVPRVILRDENGILLVDTSGIRARKCLSSTALKRGTDTSRSFTRGSSEGTRQSDIPRRKHSHRRGRKPVEPEVSEKACSETRTRIPRRVLSGKKDTPPGSNGDSFPEARAEAPSGGRVPSRRKWTSDAGTGTRRSERRLISAPKDSGMGSNVSRHSGKGLSGRRTQSSGNLCNGAKILAPSVGRILNSCGAGGVSNRDRNKFCGSLPNHLDEKDPRSGECTPDSLYNVNNNYGDVYCHPSSLRAGKDVELFFSEIPHPPPPPNNRNRCRQQQQQQDLSGGDQGYASEKSPEEELPPPLPESAPPSRQYSTIRRRKEFPFITKENTYEARLEKGSRGLGLSVTGGIDTSEKFPGLIRIKRIFPNQPAWECRMLQVGDIILSANGVPLTGLTNYEALEVLRTTPNDVVLEVSRPPGNVFSMPPPSSGEPPTPPRRDPAHVISSSHVNASDGLLSLSHLAPEPYEFEITLKRVNGRLGFMLRKEDESVLGHCVRALVREPALSDGRIRPGDKIVTVNGVDISPMSHEEAVTYLRQCGEEVRLKLYRDPAQTPVSALSPTESCKALRPKPALRKEAVDMLCDLAVKKLSPSDSSSSSGRSRLRGSSPSSSPRRRKLKRSEAEDSGTEKPQRPDFLDLCAEAEDEVDSGATDAEDGKRRLRIGSDELESEVSASMPTVGYENPSFRSANPSIRSEAAASSGERLSDREMADEVFDEGGSHGLLKWKGVLFKPEDGVDESRVEERRSDDEEMITVELCRGWNSRLGFSLQSSGSATCISAIYADSVAAKDGRLRPGDRVVMINDESTEDMATSDVIDLLRKIRGSIAITVRRGRKQKS